MTPTQFSLAEIFQDFAKVAVNLKKLAFDALAQARKYLALGDTLNYSLFLDIYLNYKQEFAVYLDTINAIWDIITPMPLSGGTPLYASISDFQKEWVTKARGVVSDYTMYLPQKFLELITVVLPVGLLVPIPFIGNVDIIQFFSDAAYRTDIKTNIYNNLSSVSAAISAAISGMYAGTFGGVSCPQMSAQEIWCWVCQQISTGGMKLLHDAFTALIDNFNGIWSSLGLPALPALITLDIESLILGVIDSVKSTYLSLITSAKGTYKQVQDLFSRGEASKEQLTLARNQLLQVTSEQWSAIVDGLKNLSIFGIPLGSLLTINTDVATYNSETIVSDLISQAKDFVNNYVLNIFIEWMDKVKSFFNAIGLSSIVAFITFDFCDFLSLIGLTIP